MSWSKKKFWSSLNITFSDEQQAYVILRDGKIYKSAKGNILKIPSAFLAKKVENEWEKITKEVIPSKLIFTNVLEQINDIDDESTAEFLRVLLEYAETDLLCYRVSSPKKLKALQERKWDPILSIYDREFSIKMASSDSLNYVSQDKESLDKFLGILKAYESPKLFLIYRMTQLLGSALLSVLVEKNLVNEKKAWMLSRIEEDWQKKIWGKDEESIEAEKFKRKDFKLLNLCLRHLVEY